MKRPAALLPVLAAGVLAWSSCGQRADKYQIYSRPQITKAIMLPSLTDDRSVFPGSENS